MGPYLEILPAGQGRTKGWRQQSRGNGDLIYTAWQPGFMLDFSSQCSTAYLCRIKAEAAPSLPTVPSFLQGAQAGFLQNITRDCQAGLDRNPPCAHATHHMKDAEMCKPTLSRLCVTLQSTSALDFPSKSRLPKYSQPSNRKNSVLIHAWTFAEPKKIHLFDGRGNVEHII